ncbi:MAG: ABC transporter ATP-binding protein [Candidatus Altiarchaeota archaeon]|nr:ABC transporter ATP-binding protein [Candidatus Altiarchaeota archaeon]
MPSIELRGVGRQYGDVTAVKGASLHIKDNEYVTLLGPSGCGKTTLLRMIAGLIRPTEGDILIDGVSVVDVPPEDRNIGYLFQNYALFPHMNVSENVGYGLLARGESKGHTSRVTEEMLRFVDLLEWAKFMPRQLSGGMQQRISLVRSLAAGCRTFFLDEPMSSLDPKIGIKLRYEIKKTARRLKLTVLHVTHDQADAMSVSDRIIVMKRGGIAQVGTPRDVYYSPASPYVAHFIGESNFIHATPAGENMLLAGSYLFRVSESVGSMQDIIAAIRPERIRFERRLENTLDGAITDLDFLGPTTRFWVDVGGLSLSVLTAKRPDLVKGDNVSVYLPPDDIMVFPGVRDLKDELQVF